MRRIIVQADVQAALEAALDTEGFFHTGDLMRMDADGYLFNLGRIGRLVKVRDWMTNPAEVEGVLRGLPGVAEALCWSVPHDLLGNVLHAMVVPERGAVLDVQALRKACRSQLERHKVPHDLQVVAQLPQTPTGKVMLRPTGQS